MKPQISKFYSAISNIRKDGWSNILTGLGVAERDKRMSATPLVRLFSQTELENLYRADDIAQKIIDRIPKEMFRAGYEIIVQNNDKAGSDITQYLKKLNADETFRKALKLARLHGGSGIILGIDDGQDASYPVNYNAISSIKWITVLDKWRLVAQTIEDDLTKPNFGMPKTYTLQSLHAKSEQMNSIIHASRVIRFEGIELPEQAFIVNQYWGDSYLSSVYNPLLNFNSAHDSAAATMQDFVQSVYELENLADLIASGDDELVQKRLQLLDATRSIIKAIVIQKGESFRRDSMTITGMPELLTKIENRLVAASGMPHTILLGEGSEGQTSGNSEKTDFYDLVAQEQTSVLMPRQLDLIKLITLAKDGVKVNIDDVSIKYKPLWEMDEKEQALVYKTNAEADAIYLMNGVLDPIEVTKSRFTSPDSTIQVDIEAREEITRSVPQQQFTQYDKMDAYNEKPQCLFLSKKQFQSMDKAAAWIAANNYSNANAVETDSAFEFKQCEPTDFANGSLIISDLGDGIKAIVGQIKSEVLPQSEQDLLLLGNLIKNSF